ncbi:M20/M25/M40 family metallo-hydrolase [Prosthecomicrobium sp. N25]|uniref:M20/M25/M40 family metallo-hydrolase n=1 Tax=Prosthecomicrobium sp. N25 TaxID=3129254 RepID=UPI0030789094
MTAAPSRAEAVAAAVRMLDDGRFEADLRRRVAIPTVSRMAEHAGDLARYLTDEMVPTFRRLGFTTAIWEHPAAPGPFLLAERIEDPALVTVLQYGHGDVVAGLDTLWEPGLAPFVLTERDGRWYGRGTADNKGQHGVNIAALEAVLALRGRLGFNVKYLIEMGEECGSLGLDEVCAAHAADLAADVLVASDGPRLALDRPTLFLGARGGISFELSIEARKDFQHSGNWGGILANPGIELCHAITDLVDCTGRIKVPALTPGTIPDNVRRALQSCRIAPEPGDPPIDAWWGEPGLTPEEKVYAWSSFEVMEFECGNLARPLYAIPPRARARVQLRFPVGVDPDGIVPAVREALAAAGHHRVVVKDPTDAVFLASRLDPDHPWVRRVAASLAATLGAEPAILPNLGGSLPNSIFSDRLGLPTVWIPHSYPGCLQHAPNEHLPIAIAREGLAIMAGLYWDLGERAGG